MKIPVISLAILGLASLTLPTLAADLTYKDLEGKWTVTAVAVPTEGVQALVDDDPQYIGAEVEFSPGKITWIKGTKERPIDPSIDDCTAAPSLVPWTADPDVPDAPKLEGGFNVLCGTEGWGPAATVVAVDAKTITLYWYDNGVLTLVRR